MAKLALGIFYHSNGKQETFFQFTLKLPKFCCKKDKLPQGKNLLFLIICVKYTAVLFKCDPYFK